MVPRTARRSRSLRDRLARRGALATLALFLTLGGAAVFNASPASAATSPGTDTIYVIENGKTTLTESLPAGTPEVVTPLATAIYVVCAPFSGGTLAIGAVQVCYTYQFGPPAGTVVVAAVQPSIGVLLPEGWTCTPPTSGIDVVDGSSGVYLAPPGTAC
jgi:hypothetical protein